MTLPDYINCKSKTIYHCDFYMHNDCPETCAYALDVRGLGVGATMIPPGREDGLVKQIRKESE